MSYEKFTVNRIEGRCAILNDKNARIAIDNASAKLATVIETLTNR